MIKKRLMKLTATALALTLALTACSSGSSGTASTAAAQPSSAAQETQTNSTESTPTDLPTLRVAHHAIYHQPSDLLHPEKQIRRESRI